MKDKTIYVFFFVMFLLMMSFRDSHISQFVRESEGTKSDIFASDLHLYLTHSWSSQSHMKTLSEVNCLLYWSSIFFFDWNDPHSSDYFLSFYLCILRCTLSLFFTSLSLGLDTFHMMASVSFNHLTVTFTMIIQTFAKLGHLHLALSEKWVHVL